jgi:Zn-dependent protease with chaperone function
MTGPGAVRRLELALAMLAASVALIALIVALDVLRFHLPALLAGRHGVPADHHDVALAILGLVDAVVLWRTVPSLARQMRAHRRLRGLPVAGRRTVAGHAVTIVHDLRPLAFCAGLLRPALYVSDAALARLTPAQLGAVVEHEAHHARRRDPLRLAVAQVAADGFGFLAPLRRLPTSQAAIADLAADAAAVAALGTPQPLAAAMVRLREPAPERVDHLLGRPLAVPHRALSACALAALGGLGALAITLAVLPSDPALPLALLPALAVPALLAFRAAR